jgi:hypothetical protein
MRSTESSPVGFMTPAARMLSQFTVPLILLAALTGSAAAQEPSDTRTTPPSAEAPSPPSPASPSVNVAKLPVDLSRLQRQLRASAERTLQDGTNLKVFVDVYAFAPPLMLFTRQDIFGDGAVPGGAPTHQQIIDQNTPEEHRGSNTVRKGGINILGKKK